ncbi:MAG TPA: lactate utilization protein C [Usitatibacter sp.]|nr:lactate utilization protein C [Usitatibacter sp.]
MSARENILARIRKAQGRSGSEPTAAELAQVREAIAAPIRGPQPSISRPADAMLQFRGECDRVGTTHTDAASLAEVPAQVGRYLEINALEPRIVVWPELAALDWAAAGLQAEARPARGDDATGVTGCFCAIAETGTLLLLSAPGMPKVTALLPETHVAVVRRSRLVLTLEDAFALLRREKGELPRATWFVSGPSRTADIEQTIVIGAHGPYRVHVIVVP